MKSYLGVAADVQKGGAKLWRRSPKERCQGKSAMACREEAGSLHQAGGPMSQNEGRVPPSRTKPSLLVSRSSWPTPNAVRWPGGMVRHALMLGKRFALLTDEVPRGSSHCSTTWSYKALPKCSGHASVAGTATPWPRLQGCLQRQSKSPQCGHRKAKPQSESGTSTGPRDQLASAKKRSHTSSSLYRPEVQQEEDGSVLSALLPVLRGGSAPTGNRTRPACGRGRPVREICSPVQYGESTPLRQRGGGGFGLPLTH